MEALGLRADSSGALPFEICSNEEGWLLALTGSGPYKAAAATAALLGHCPTQDGAFLLANFGIAGGHSGQRTLGEGLLLHRVTEESSGRSFYPERGVRAPWSEAPGITVTKPVWGREPQTGALTPSPLYDMESYGVCSAAEAFLPNSQWLLGRVVSDLVDSRQPPDFARIARDLKTLYSQRAAEFIEIAGAHRAFLASEPRSAHLLEVRPWVEAWRTLLKDRLRLTVHQERSLTRALRAYALLHPSPQRERKAVQLQEIAMEYEGEGKRERAQAHTRIIDQLQTL